MESVCQFRPVALIIPVFALMIGVGALMAEDDEKSNSAPVANLALSSEVAARQESLFVTINAGYDVVKPIFEKSCFDCHSKFTKYPWYHKLPGIKQLIDSDIKEGREHLDMSTGFPFHGKGLLLEILGDMKSEIVEGGMPLLTYRMIHWGTGLSGARRDTVVNWLDSTQVRIMHFYDAERIPYERPKQESQSGDEDDD